MTSLRLHYVKVTKRENGCCSDSNTKKKAIIQLNKSFFLIGKVDFRAHCQLEHCSLTKTHTSPICFRLFFKSAFGSKFIFYSPIAIGAEIPAEPSTVVANAGGGGGGAGTRPSCSIAAAAFVA